MSCAMCGIGAIICAVRGHECSVGYLWLGHSQHLMFYLLHTEEVQKSTIWFH